MGLLGTPGGWVVGCQWEQANGAASGQGLDEAAVAGMRRRFEAGLDAELAEDVVELALDGADRYH